MNSRKQDVLNTLDGAAKVHDESLTHSKRVVTHPEEYGWWTSLLTAVVIVPLTGISAVLTDLNRVMVAMSDDEVWNRQLPPPVDDADSTPDSLGG
jgi:hypothetical protein